MDIESTESGADTAVCTLKQEKRTDAGQLLSKASRERENHFTNESDLKRRKVDGGSPKEIDTEEVFENSNGALMGVARLLADLLDSMFDAKWEVRHGSLLAMRHILMASQFASSVQNARSTVQGSIVNKWIEECLIRCTCVLALDQFVDYSAEGSIAPVRELCAQVTGVLLGTLHGYGRLVKFLQSFRTLFGGLTWHAYHGGLLGLKYLVQAHTSHAVEFVPVIHDDVVHALQKSLIEEDVLVLAMGMLEDFAAYMAKVPSAKIESTGRFLWGSLIQCSDRALYRASVVRALAAWYQAPKPSATLQNDSSIASRAWTDLVHVISMLHHHSSVVKISTARFVAAIASIDSIANPTAISEFSKCFTPHLLLQLAVETEQSVTDELLGAWKAIIKKCASSSILSAIVSSYLHQWVSLLWSNESLGVLNIEDLGTSGIIDSISTFHHPESVAWRVTFADALGYMASLLPLGQETTELLQILGKGFVSASGEMQCGCLLLLSRWALYEKVESHDQKLEESSRVKYIRAAVGDTLDSFAMSKWRPTMVKEPKAIIHGQEVAICYQEQLKSVKRVLTMLQRATEIFSSAGITVDVAPSKLSSLQTVTAADISLEAAEKIADLPYDQLKSCPSAYEAAHFKRQDLFVLDELIQSTFARVYQRVQGLGSCAYCFVMPIPTKKSGFLVAALMESLKGETDVVFRRLASEALATFALSQARIQKKCVDKIVSNLCNSAIALEAENLPTCDCCSLSNEAPGLPADELEKTKVRVAGALSALKSLCTEGGPSVFEICPQLEENIVRGWESAPNDQRALQRSLKLVILLVPSLDQTCAASFCIIWLERCVNVLMMGNYHDCAPDSAHSKHLAAVAIATICKEAHTYRSEAMLVVYSRVFCGFTRGCGEVGAAVLVLDTLVRLIPANSLFPYVPSLVHYAMTSMTSQNKTTSTAAARAFSKLVPLIPLQMDLGNSSSEVSIELKAIVRENQASRHFLESFLHGTAIQPTDVRPWLGTGISLREYQQHGVDWLTFMARNNLHGILADDMGLGKTLQTLAAMAATLSVTDRTGDDMPKCLVVCPPIVASHWIAEAQKCLPKTFGVVVDYSGSAAERKKLRKKFGDSTTAPSDSRCVLIITTYAVIRIDEEGFLASKHYVFVVLDEAHLVRNPTTALFRSVQTLRANHRLALSGTPLQNNVGDLWALFEFLIPGYLGEFSTFRRDFVLPIAKSKERNATAKQKEVAAIAITQLHQKVLPFILRRTKDQVLWELPPKTISNVLLPLSSIQERLYALASSSSSSSDTTKSEKVAHVFADLQQLRRICVHPSLARDELVSRSLKQREQDAARKWSSSGKLLGLRALLAEVCAVGDESAGERDEFQMSNHRVLVFAHLHETLDLTAQMLMDAMPHVSYRRLDGRTPPSQRAQIVKQFNDDPSIDILLLTTAVGGLGLTLTGADTVIFLEHSWNPFVDLQAMDRAHRIGQRRAVRVFRLIMKDSLEEHILNLQAFKQGVAETVVKQQSTADSSMNNNTVGILGLLQASSASVTAKDVATTTKTKTYADGHIALPGAARELLDEIGELWDESQYRSLAFPAGEES